jgi:hypothetical protein
MFFFGISVLLMLRLDVPCLFNSEVMDSNSNGMIDVVLSL